METPNIERLNTFELGDQPGLDVAVLGALELFEKYGLPVIDTEKYDHPLVVGSGGAEACSRIVFEKADAVFASESSYGEKLENIPGIDRVVLVSASGEKHAPGIIETAKKFGKKVILLTNTLDSSASRLLDTEIGDEQLTLRKNREPYTYNTSTYMGMIMARTGENPATIAQFIRERIDAIQWPDFSKYDKYYLAVPTELSGITRLLQLKFIELFGRNIARDIETQEYMKVHATTVVPSDEMFISFGEPNNDWGQPENRLFIPLPESCDYGAMMAIGYFTIGQIQKAYPDMYKDNIVAYTEKVSSKTGQNIKPIVEGNASQFGV